MRTPLLSLVVFIAFVASGFADPLPFAVNIGGQAAKEGVPYGRVDAPVDANAAIEVKAKASPVIINLHALGATGQPDAKKPPAVIMLSGTTGALDRTLDGKKPAPGRYIMSIVADGKTASLTVTVK